jgi:drug/metabolite transporter (DMT)-like permease
MLIGFLVFHERPDGWMLAGAALIIGSGLYSFMREQRLRRLSMRAAAE